MSWLPAVIGALTDDGAIERSRAYLNNKQANLSAGHSHGEDRRGDIAK